MKKKACESILQQAHPLEKQTENRKKIITFCIVFFISIVCAYADTGGISKLDDYGRMILGLFTSFWMKATCTVAFILICIRAVTVGRDEPGLMKKYIPWLIGVMLLLSAGEIVNFLFSGNEDIASQLGLLVELLPPLVCA
ncbi:TrbC/VirB2 family protein [Treponema vincentii]|uniref:TrbC/VirB2 family protein n=1 Tax=Treponema vincentii TaxID=69710 RepID=UPI0020A608B3|nr:TrbC/VirB2 family protein [Treponema vincentii]UTC47743.1 hypothetical protein E4N73_02255 [Treponema vincentii]